MERLHLLYAALGTLGVLAALFSRRLRDLPVSEPLLALVLGVVLGPPVLGLVELTAAEREPLLLEGTRLLLAGSVMAAALRFDASDLRPLLRPLTLLLVGVLPVAALLTGAAALLLGLPLALAAVVGACLSPTDPVLAASVVTGEPAQRDLPARLRQLLTIESGANDGLALPLVGLALVAALPSLEAGSELGQLVYEVVVAALVGAAAGALAGRAVLFATRHDDLDPGPKIVFTLLLAVAVLGLARLLGTDGVLAVFVAGLAYNRAVPSSDREPQENIDEAVNRYLVLPLFVVLGAVLPWADWARLGPTALIFVVAVLVLRRPPLVVALARPLGLRLRDAGFAGWFGPMGVSALFYVAHSRAEGVDDPRVFAAVTLAVAASVVAHGVSATPGRRLYARR